jgi:hypothetical protein
MKYLLTCLLVFGLSVSDAQSYYFNVKGGLTLGQQSWDNAVHQNGLLFAFHGALGLETFTETGSSLMMQLGYQPRGSAIRYQSGYGVDQAGKVFTLPAQTINFEFDNVALIVGFKNKGVLGSADAYYTLGLRAEYTVSTTLQEPGNSFSYYGVYPNTSGVNKWNYGLTLGGGYEFKFSELVGGFVELNVHPDVSKQYFTPSYQGYVYDYIAQKQTIQTLPEQSIRNLTFEVSVGVKFLRKVVVVE